MTNTNEPINELISISTLVTNKIQPTFHPVWYALTISITDASRSIDCPNLTHLPHLMTYIDEE